MIWLIGNRGMLGAELDIMLDESFLEHIGTDKELSIMKYEDLMLHVRQNPDIRWIINCAAYTEVDKAEYEIEYCYSLNKSGPKNLATIASAIGAKIIHISTDYVFSGDRSSPYKEDSPKAPVCVYGRAKAEGEEEVIKACDKAIIIRTSWLYGKHGRNFVFTMLELMKTRDTVKVVSDQWGSPTWTKDLARAIVTILKASKHHYGIFHYSNDGVCTWYDFALEIYRLGREYHLLDRDCQIIPIRSDEYPTKAKRPMYSVLAKDRIKECYKEDVPGWRFSLKKFIEEIALDAKGS